MAGSHWKKLRVSRNWTQDFLITTTTAKSSFLAPRVQKRLWLRWSDQKLYLRSLSSRLLISSISWSRFDLMAAAICFRESSETECRKVKVKVVKHPVALELYRHRAKYCPGNKKLLRLVQFSIKFRWHRTSLKVMYSYKLSSRLLPETEHSQHTLFRAFLALCDPNHCCENREINTFWISHPQPHDHEAGGLLLWYNRRPVEVLT